MSDYTGPDHKVTVTVCPYSKTILPSGKREEGVEVDHDIEHPEACDQLKYGQMCALDHWLSDWGCEDAGMPMAAGVYLVSYRGWGPDHNGESDCELVVTEVPASDGQTEQAGSADEPDTRPVSAGTAGPWT